MQYLPFYFKKNDTYITEYTEPDFDWVEVEGVAASYNYNLLFAFPNGPYYGITPTHRRNRTTVANDVTMQLYAVYTRGKNLTWVPDDQIEIGFTTGLMRLTSTVASGGNGGIVIKGNNTGEWYLHTSISSDGTRDSLVLWSLYDIRSIAPNGMENALNCPYEVKISSQEIVSSSPDDSSYYIHKIEYTIYVKETKQAILKIIRKVNGAPCYSFPSNMTSQANWDILYSEAARTDSWKDSLAYYWPSGLVFDFSWDNEEDPEELDKHTGGILERFLKLIGYYIEDDHNDKEENEVGQSILPDIRNILNVLDVMTVRDDLLDYIFFWLGWPLQEWSNAPIDASMKHDPPEYVWFLEPDTPLMSWTLIGWKEEVPYNASKIYTELDRYFIRYAKPLYAIRGSRKFYETILSEQYYDLDAVVEEEINAGCNRIGKVNIYIGNDDLSAGEQRRLTNILGKYKPINVNLYAYFGYKPSGGESLPDANIEAIEVRELNIFSSFTTNGTLYVLGTTSSLYYGETLSSWTSAGVSNIQMTRIQYYNGLFVAVGQSVSSGQSNFIYTSTDGQTWVESFNTTIVGKFCDLALVGNNNGNPSYWYALSDTEGTYKYYVSSNGTSWSTLGNIQDNNQYKVIAGKTGVSPVTVIMANGIIKYSTQDVPVDFIEGNGIDTGFIPYRLLYDSTEDIFVASGTIGISVAGVVYTSADGINWSRNIRSWASIPISFAYGNGIWVVVDTGGYLHWTKSITSSADEDWRREAMLPSSGSYPYDIIYEASKGQFTVMGRGQRFWTVKFGNAEYESIKHEEFPLVVPNQAYFAARQVVVVEGIIIVTGITSINTVPSRLHGAIYRSVDNTNTWQQVLDDGISSPLTSSIEAICVGANNRLVAFQQRSEPTLIPWYSDDLGLTWTLGTPSSTGTTNGVGDVVYAEDMGLYVLVGGINTNNRDLGMSWYSTDGIAWSSGTGAFGAARGVAYGNGVFINVGTPGANELNGLGAWFVKSTDGINWTKFDTGMRYDTFSFWQEIATDGNGLWWAAGSQGRYAVSRDNGDTWELRQYATGFSFTYALRYINDTFVANFSIGGISYYRYYNKESDTWLSMPIDPNTTVVDDIAYDATRGQYIGVGGTQYELITSPGYVPPDPGGEIPDPLEPPNNHDLC